MRLIDENSVQIGVISVRDAMTMAEERGLDLVEVAPTAVPPVCRIMDYGKFRYEQSKKEREARKNQKQVEIKQIRLEPKTDDHDLDVKAKQARRFLLDGDKVKFNLRFRGREIFHQEIGMKILDGLADVLRDIAAVEQRPLMEGRVLSLLLAPNAKAKAEAARAAKAAAKAQQAAAASGAPVPVKVPEPVDEDLHDEDLHDEDLDDDELDDGELDDDELDDDELDDAPDGAVPGSDQAASAEPDEKE